MDLEEPQGKFKWTKEGLGSCSSSSDTDNSHYKPGHNKGKARDHGCKPPCEPQEPPPKDANPQPVTVNVTVSCCGHKKGMGSCCCGGGHHGPGAGGGTGDGSNNNGTRPGHHTGTSDGSIGKGVGTPGGIISVTTRPPTVWPGPRSKLYLPFLFIRANEGDLGARPISGVFWESPDIIILPGIAASDAPERPSQDAQLGAVARANSPNTLYAHVWNMGLADCHGAIVEFYWFNPALGFDSKSANLVARTTISLARRGSRPSHRIVKCPVSWTPKFLNGGHECLVVRLFDPAVDTLSTPPWDARQNRHIGQRNIHVMSATEAGIVPVANIAMVRRELAAAAAAFAPTIGINIGSLYGGQAQVDVKRAETTTMPWLQLVTMQRKVVPQTGTATGDVGITSPVSTGTTLPNLGSIPDPRTVGVIGDSHGVTDDDQQVGFITKDGNPGNGNAHVYRVTGTQNGSQFGGYTVVLLGS